MTGASTSDAPRFLADENFNLAIVAGLHRARPAMDLLTAPEAGILHWADPEVLAWATRHDRILLTHDVRTMPDHFYRHISQLPHDQHCPGVMLLPQRLGIGQAIMAVLEIWDLSIHDEWRDVLTRLPL